MAVNATCANCNDEPLINDNLDVGGKQVQISRCPKCEGKIKSPMCCVQDMSCSIQLQNKILRIRINGENL